MLSEVPEKKRKLLHAAMTLILHKGYSGTTVDEICTRAGVTKGSFFHYFASKEEIGLAAMDAWMGAWQQIVAAANLEAIEDPLDRVFGLFKVMEHAYTLPDLDAGCVVGAVAQEQALPNETFRRSSHEHFQQWVLFVARLLDEAKAVHPPAVDFDSEEVAWWLQSFVQGSMIMSKARNDREVVLTNVRHCQNYIRLLFGRPSPR